MKTLLTIQLTLLPMAAFADPGHIAGAFGHDHWLGVAAIGAAVALGLWTIIKDTKKSEDEEVQDADTDEAQEA